jgi:hypothetical protein
MDTAVLAEKPGVLRGEEVWSGREGAPYKDDALEGAARRLRLAGHDAEVVYEEHDSEEVLKSLNEDVMKYLDLLPDVTGWESKNEKVDSSATN